MRITILGMSILSSTLLMLGGQDIPDARAQQDPGRTRRGSRERDVRIEAPAILVAQLRRARGRRRLATGGDVGVLGDVERVEAARFSLARKLDWRHRAIGRMDGDTEVHGRLVHEGARVGEDARRGSATSARYRARP